MTKRKRTSQKGLLPIVVAALVCLGLFFFIKSLTNSLIFHPIERINFVIMDEYPLYYSIDTKNHVDYLVSFYPDLKIDVPGGYGRYRFGALGKLKGISHDPLILKKAFSNATGTFTLFTFTPKEPKITYGLSGLAHPREATFRDIFLYDSNASFFDRVYIYMELLKRKSTQYTFINEFPVKAEGTQRILSAPDFARRYLGFFYQRSYRTEKRTVQIIYTSYATAQAVGRIIEGNGIRVVDLGQGKEQKRCEVVEGGERFSKSASDIAWFFGCKLVRADVTVSDIIVKMGEDMEKEWEIK